MRSVARCAALAAIVSCAWTASEPAQAPEGSPVPEQADATGADHALLVGCTEYLRSSRDDLKGCENDVRLIERCFADVLGVAPERMRVLTGWPDDEAARPSRANILGALDRYAEELRAGDRLLIFLAGHGSRQPDERGGDELDGYDEVFLPADVGRAVSRRGGRVKVIERAITDDELYAAISKMLERGVRVCMFSDSCHSATLARGGAFRPRGIEPEALGMDPPEVGARGARRRERPGEAVRDGFTGLYAVQADEKAQEGPIDVGDGTRIHGVFSWSLARALSRTGGDVTFDALLRQVVAGYRELGFHDITPFLQGDRAAPVRSGGGERRSSLFARRAPDGIVVDGGILHGLYPGSRLAVRTSDGARVLGELRVVAASAVKAACEELGPGALADLTAEARLPVEVLETPAGTRPVRVHVSAGDASAWREQLAQLDPGRARVQVVEARDEADWTLESHEGSWRLRPGNENDERRFRVETRDVPATLFGLHRVATLLRLPARSRPFPERLSVQVLRDGELLEDGATVAPGTVLELRARNGTAEARDLWAFWVDADQGVTRTFPDPGDALASPFLAPAAKSRQQAMAVAASALELFVTDGTQGTEHLVFLAVPHGTSDLSFLETSRLARDTRGGAGEGEASRLFDELAFGDRGAARARGLGAGTFARLVTFDVSWEPVGAPTLSDTRPLTLAGRLDPTYPPVPAGLPDPWAIATAFVGDTSGARLVVDAAAEPRVLLIDLDPPDVRAGDGELGRLVAARGFAADVALVFERASGRRIAYYDVDLAGGPGDGRPAFELIRVDADGDGVADVEHRFAGGAWTRRDAPAAPWLRLADLDFALRAPADPYAAEDAAFALFHELGFGSRGDD